MPKLKHDAISEKQTKDSTRHGDNKTDDANLVIAKKIYKLQY